MRTHRSLLALWRIVSMTHAPFRRTQALARSSKGRVSAPRTGRPVTDAQLVAATRVAMRGFVASVPSQQPRSAAAFSILETAGGVCSPAPSGTLQVQWRMREVLVRQSSSANGGSATKHSACCSHAVASSAALFERSTADAVAAWVSAIVDPRTDLYPHPDAVHLCKCCTGSQGP